MELLKVIIDFPHQSRVWGLCWCCGSFFLFPAVSLNKSQVGFTLTSPSNRSFTSPPVPSTSPKIVNTSAFDGDQVRGNWNLIIDFGGGPTIFLSEAVISFIAVDCVDGSCAGRRWIGRTWTILGSYHVDKWVNAQQTIAPTAEKMQRVNPALRGWYDDETYNPFPLTLNVPQLLKTRVRLKCWKNEIGQFDFWFIPFKKKTYKPKLPIVGLPVCPHDNKI